MTDNSLTKRNCFSGLLFLAFTTAVMLSSWQTNIYQVTYNTITNYYSRLQKTIYITKVDNKWLVSVSGSYPAKLKAYNNVLGEARKELIKKLSHPNSTMKKWKDTIITPSGNYISAVRDDSFLNVSMLNNFIISLNIFYKFK